MEGETGVPVAEPTPADATIAADVHQSLLDEDVLRQVDAQTIHVAVRGGTVTLRGHVSRAMHRERAEAAVHRAAPDAPLVDELIADDDLEATVARALARDRQTGPLLLRVRVDEGVVHLFGEASPVEAAAAEEIAAAVPGVRAVVGHLPGNVGPSEAIVLPRIGSPVEATDGEVGRVELVVVDVRFRHVTHFVASGRLPPRGANGAPGEYPLVPQRKVVPVTLVDRVTDVALFLKVDLAEVVRLPDYRDEAFAAPPPRWQPPADFTLGQVRVAVPPP